MSKFHVYHQHDSMQCGIACLQMICKYHGKEYSQDTLSRYCFATNEGVSLLGISEAATRTGTAHHVRTGNNRTITQSPPCPVSCIGTKINFVVLYRIKKGENMLHCRSRQRTCNLYERGILRALGKHQTGGEEKGIALLLEPTEQFYAQKSEETIPTQNRVKFLWNYLKKYKRFFTQLILGLLLGSLLQLIFPFLTQAIVDTGIGGKDIGFVWLVLLAETMLLFSRTAIDFIRSKILLHISTRINISLISDFFIKLMKLPMKFFDTKLMGDLLQRIEDHRRVEQFLTSSSLSLLFSFFTFLVFGVVLAIYNLGIFLVFLFGTSLYAGWIILFLKKRRQLDYKYFEQAGRNRNVTYQLIGGMQEIKLQGCEQRKRWEWEDVQADLFKVNLQSLNLQQVQQAGSITINEVKNILITVLAATAVIHGSMTLGMMLAVQYIIGQLNSPVEQLIQFIYSWQDVSISLDRMNEIHTETNEEKCGK